MEKQKNSIRKNSSLLSLVEGEESIEEVCELLWFKIKEYQTHEKNQDLLNNVLENFFNKLLVSNYCSERIKKFLTFLEQNNLINQNYEPLLKSLYNKQLLQNNQLSTGNREQSQSKQVQGDFAYSFLDLGGNFLWSDLKTKKILEFKSIKSKKKNLFDFMFEPSQKYI